MKTLLAFLAMAGIAGHVGPYVMAALFSVAGLPVLP